MIKLYNLLKEHENGEQPKPYMYSPVGFSCAVCEYYYEEDGKHMCKSQEYAEYMGTNELVDEEGEQIQDPTKWCSNWFEPKEEEESLDEMADSDPDLKMIMSKYQSGTDEEKSMISAALGLGFKSNINAVYKELRDAGKEDMEYIKDQLGVVDIDEESKGLWHNIRAKRARGEKPARKGSKAYNQAVKAAKEINKNK